jgi:hypothetical protein
MTVPEVTVHNLQRKISVDVAQLEKFTGNAVQHSLQLQKGKQTDLRKSREVSVWLISDRRMALLHRKFLGRIWEFAFARVEAVHRPWALASAPVRRSDAEQGGQNESGAGENSSRL